MRTTITRADVLAILQKMATDIEGQKDYLCELDGAMGDGDQGVTMSIGFGAIRSGLAALHDQDSRYGYAQHKGYATPGHLAALERFGYSPQHRRSFRPASLFDKIASGGTRPPAS